MTEPELRAKAAALAPAGDAMAAAVLRLFAERDRLIESMRVDRSPSIDWSKPSPTPSRVPQSP